MKKENLLIKKKLSIRKLWWNIIIILVITIITFSSFLTYYSIINNQSYFEYSIKNINMIMAISLWSIYLLIIVGWAFLFRIKCKKNQDYKLIRMYFLNYFVEKKVNIWNLNKDYAQKIQKNLRKFVLILNLIAIIFVCYTVISLIMLDVKILTLFIYSCCSLVFLLTPLLIVGFLVFNYKNPIFIK